MTTINLRDFYPWYTNDELIEVPDAVAEELLADIRYEKAHKRRTYRNKAQYTLNAGDGIESEAVYAELSPHQVYELKLRFCRLCMALNSLPEAQGRRIEAHYILRMSVTEIARAEGVDESAVRAAIKRGLRDMKKYLRKLF